MKLGDKLAKIFTGAMATWTFIAIILGVCVLEIYGNKVGWFHFDPTMLVLNTVLSLWAAVQGSIIMIAQKQADAKLMFIITSIFSLLQQMESQELGDENDINVIKESLKRLEKANEAKN